MVDLIHRTFNIPTGFQGAVISTLARLDLDRAVDEVNDEILDPWAELQLRAGITKVTPLSPFMEKELLRDKDLSLDGAAFERATGFAYSHPRLTCEEIEDVLASYRRMGWWPDVAL